MVMFIFQTLILIAIVFVIGAAVGCWLKSTLGRSAETETSRVSSAQLSGNTRFSDPVVSEDEEAPAPTLAAPVMEKPQPAGQLANDPKQADPKQAAPKPDVKKTTRTSAKSTKKAPPKAPKSGKASKNPAQAKPDTTKKAAALPEVPDDLKKIKGIGRVIEGKLNAEGITRYAQIAAWTKTDAAAFSEKLAFRGRIEREDWIAQAKVLAKGGKTDFSKRVARGEVKSSS
jgi:predicted flap endonuclease-1-like 5' DNA nuclease